MRRRGFTLIELMVVVAILLLLIGMLFLGLKQVAGPAKQEDTRKTLQTAKAMFTDYDQATHLRALPASPQIPDGPNLWTGFAALATPPPAVPSGANGLVTGAVGLHMPAPSSYAPMLVTLEVMNLLITTPTNSTLYHNLPPTKQSNYVLKNVNGGTPTSFSAPVLLDSWGDPIVYVPANGLYGVHLSGDDNYVSTTQYTFGKRVIYQHMVFTWINQASGNTTPSVADTANWGGLCSPEVRPFFVSAGPDGDLSTGDDNLYSYEN